MAGLLLPERPARPIGVGAWRVNWSHPLTSGLVVAVIGGRDLVGGGSAFKAGSGTGGRTVERHPLHGPVSALTTLSGAVGFGVEVGQRWPSRARQITFMQVARLDSAAEYAMIGGFPLYNAADTYPTMTLGMETSSGSSGTGLLTYASTTSARRTLGNLASRIVYGQWQTFAARFYDASGINNQGDVWIDGASSSSGNTGNLDPTWFPSGFRSPLALLNRNATMSTPSGVVLGSHAAFLLWSRPLTPTEMRRVHYEWPQMFTPATDLTPAYAFVSASQDADTGAVTAPGVTLANTTPVGSDQFAADTFTRSVTDGWGSADIGGAWSLSGTGGSGPFDVDGSKGTIAFATADAARYAWLPDVSARDFEMSADFTWGATLAGDNGISPGFTFRQNGTTTNYTARLRVKPAGTVTADIFSTGGDGSLNVSNQSVSAADWSAPGTVVHFKVQVSGASPTSIKLKAWTGSNAEPAWQVSTTDSTLTAGQSAGDVGIYVLSWAGNTEPTTVTVDNLRAGPLMPEVTAPGAGLAVTAPTVTTDATVPAITAPSLGCAVTAPDVAADDPPDVFAFDTFTRSTSDGWGTADTGGAWTLFGNAADFDVTGSKGTIALGGGITGGVARAARLATVSADEADVIVDFKLSATATGSGIALGVLARAQSNTSHYMCRLQVRPSTSGAHRILFLKDSTTQVGFTHDLTGVDWSVADGRVIRVKFQVSGTDAVALRGKAWCPELESEPAWQAEEVDASAPLGAGSVGVYLYNFSSNAAETVEVDNFTGQLPQTTVFAEAPSVGILEGVAQSSGDSETPPFAQDSFTRSGSNGWGTATEYGGAWTVTGTAANWSTTGTKGQVVVPAGNNREAYLPSVSATDVQVSTRVQITAGTLASGGSSGLWHTLYARNASNQRYVAQFRVCPVDGLRIWLLKFTSVTGNTYTTLNPSNFSVSATLPAGWSTDQFRLEFQVTGGSTTTLKARMWLASGAQPGWQITATDSSSAIVAAGSVGMLARAQGGASTANDLTLQFDDFLASEAVDAAIVTPTPPAVGLLHGGAYVAGAAPKVLHTSEEISRVQTAVSSAGATLDYWNYVKSSRGSTSYTVQQNLAAYPTSGGTKDMTVFNTAGQKAAVGDALMDVSSRAYALGLRYAIDGSTAAADKVVDILDVWSSQFLGFWTEAGETAATSDNKLYASWSGVHFARAAALVWGYAAFDAIKDQVRDWFWNVWFRTSAYSLGGAPNPQPDWDEASTTAVLFTLGYGINGRVAQINARVSIGAIVGGGNGQAAMIAARDDLVRILPSLMYYGPSSHHDALNLDGYPEQAFPTTSSSLTTTAVKRYFMFGSSAPTPPAWRRGQVQETGRDLSHAMMGMGPLAEAVATIKANGLGDLFDASQLGDVLADSWELHAGLYNQALDVAWDTYSGSISTLDSSGWAPTSDVANYGHDINWVSEAFATYYNGDKVSDFMVNGGSVDHGWEYAWLHLTVYHGRSLPQLDRLTKRLRGTGARSRDDGVAGYGVVGYANHMAFEPLFGLALSATVPVTAPSVGFEPAADTEARTDGNATTSPTVAPALGVTAAASTASTLRNVTTTAPAVDAVTMTGFGADADPTATAQSVGFTSVTPSISRTQNSSPPVTTAPFASFDTYIQGIVVTCTVQVVAPAVGLDVTTPDVDISGEAVDATVPEITAPALGMSTAAAALRIDTAFTIAAALLASGVTTPGVATDDDIQDATTPPTVAPLVASLAGTAGVRHGSTVDVGAPGLTVTAANVLASWVLRAIRRGRRRPDTTHSTRTPGSHT